MKSRSDVGQPVFRQFGQCRLPGIGRLDLENEILSCQRMVPIQGDGMAIGLDHSKNPGLSLPGRMRHFVTHFQGVTMDEFLASGDENHFKVIKTVGLIGRNLDPASFAFDEVLQSFGQSLQECALPLALGDYVLVEGRTDYFAYTVAEDATERYDLSSHTDLHFARFERTRTMNESHSDAARKDRERRKRGRKRLKVGIASGFLGYSPSIAHSQKNKKSDFLEELLA